MSFSEQKFTPEQEAAFVAKGEKMMNEDESKLSKRVAAGTQLYRMLYVEKTGRAMPEKPMYDKYLALLDVHQKAKEDKIEPGSLEDIESDTVTQLEEENRSMDEDYKEAQKKNANIVRPAEYYHNEQTLMQLGIAGREVKKDVLARVFREQVWHDLNDIEDIHYDIQEAKDDPQKVGGLEEELKEVTSAAEQDIVNLEYLIGYPSMDDGLDKILK